MSVLKVLLKKDLSEKFAGRKGQKKDIGGIILDVILTLFVVGVFVAVVSYFTKTYVSVKIGYIANKIERLYEILTMFYAVLLALLIFMGIAKLNRNLIEVSNMTLLSLPIKPFQIYISKMVCVYIDLFVTAILISLPLVALIVYWELLSWTALLLSLLFAILLPLAALCISSIFTVPYFYIKRWLNKHFIIQLFVYIILVAGAFILYSMFLKMVKSLMESGQISFVFNELNMKKIAKLCSFLVPTKFIAALYAGKNILNNSLFLSAYVVISVIICYLISKSIFSLVRQNRIGRKSEYFVKKKPRKPRKVMSSLVYKEFINVLRTPSYAFNYFAILISLPIMVVITSSLMSSLMSRLTLFNCQFEIVLCSICMYSVLLNSFCANNISRDGKFFNLMKTFPVSPKKVVFSKVLFCLITSVFSIFATSVIVYLLKYVSLLKAIAIFVITSFLNIGIICLATRKDLNTAYSAKDNENKNSTNFIVFWALVLSAIVTVLSLTLSIYLQNSYTMEIANWAICLILLGFSVLVFLLSLVYLLRKLIKKYKELML